MIPRPFVIRADGILKSANRFDTKQQPTATTTTTTNKQKRQKK
jgi:hypothetical protein